MPTPTEARARPEAPGPIWNPEAAANWSLPFTPAFGSFLHMQNWRVLGEMEKARAAGVWFVVSLVMLAAYPVLMLTLPSGQLSDIGIRGLSLVYLAVWYVAYARKQMDFVKKRYGANYPRKKWGAPIGIAIACAVAYMGVVFVLAVAVTLVREPH